MNFVASTGFILKEQTVYFSIQGVKLGISMGKSLIFVNVMGQIYDM